MSLEQLVSALEAEARAEADALVEEAREEAARIREEARQEAERRRAGLLEARSSGWRREAEAGVARARRAGREAVLRARERFLAGIRRRARDRLAGEAVTAAFRDRLVGYLEAALPPLAGRPAVITCPPALRDDVASALEEARARPAGEAGPSEAAGSDGESPADVEVRAEENAPPGFAVRSADGRIIVDATLPVRLDRLWPEIAVEVAAEADRRAGAGIP